MIVIFDQLRISDDGKSMYINAHVNNASEFADAYIEKICICLGSQIYEAAIIDPDKYTPIYSKTYDSTTREINEVINADDSDLITSFNSLYFVYVKIGGYTDSNCCYSTVNNYVLGVTFDENLLYQRVMQFTKEMTSNCSVSQGFTDFILLWNAFKAAIETEHYIPAIEYYNMLFENVSNTTTKSCGCNG